MSTDAGISESMWDVELPVVPEGWLNANTHGADVDLDTENQECDSLCLTYDVEGPCPPHRRRGRRRLLPPAIRHTTVKMVCPLRTCAHDWISVRAGQAAGERGALPWDVSSSSPGDVGLRIQEGAVQVHGACVRGLVPEKFNVAIQRCAGYAQSQCIAVISHMQPVAPRLVVPAAAANQRPVSMAESTRLTCPPPKRRR